MGAAAWTEAMNSAAKGRSESAGIATPGEEDKGRAGEGDGGRPFYNIRAVKVPAVAKGRSEE